MIGSHLEVKVYKGKKGCVGYSLKTYLISTYFYTFMNEIVREIESNHKIVKKTRVPSVWDPSMVYNKCLATFFNEKNCQNQ